MAIQPVDRAAFHARGMLVAGALGRPMRRATWAGSIVAGILAVVLATLFAERGLPGILAAAGLATLAGMLAAYLALPARTRRAFETFAWLGRRELDRIREQTGAAFTGTTPDAATRWLADNPVSPVTALARLEVLAALGRFDEAEAEAARLPAPRDDIEAVGQVLNRIQVRFVADRPPDPAVHAEVVALQARLNPASEAAAELRVGLAVATARERLAAGRPDWDEALLEVRPTLGSAPSQVLVRDVWTKLALSMFLVALAVTLLLGLLPGMLSV
jgi:hypothetical protein